MDRLPLTYAECSARFRRAASRAGLDVDRKPIDAVGPDGAALGVEVVSVGAPQPERVLVVLSGVHGVEGFIGSTLQCDFIDRLCGPDGADLLHPSNAVLLVHAVNPWGMAWWRRQNESNVDLNRNWGRSDVEPAHNDPYDRIHHLACPDTDEMPSVDQLMTDAMAMVETHGMDWLRAAITSGQYRHRDGLHYGGERTEQSNQILCSIVAERLGGLAELFVVDLHTGHGPMGEVTHLPAGDKPGQIRTGILEAAGADRGRCTCIEFGTASDEEQLIATYRDQWVYRRGDRDSPEGAEAVWAYRCCFTPDDRDWERRAMELGAAELDAAIRSLGTA